MLTISYLDAAGRVVPGCPPHHAPEDRNRRKDGKPGLVIRLLMDDYPEESIDYLRAAYQKHFGVHRAEIVPAAVKFIIAEGDLQGKPYRAKYKLVPFNTVALPLTGQPNTPIEGQKYRADIVFSTPWNGKPLVLVRDALPESLTPEEQREMIGSMIHARKVPVPLKTENKHPIMTCNLDAAQLILDKKGSVLR